MASKKLNFHYVDANQIISEYKLSENYDRKRRTKVVDVKKLNQKLIEIIDFFKKNETILDLPNWHGKHIEKHSLNKTLNKRIEIKYKKIKKYNGIIIDSHLSHYLPKEYVDFCVVTKCGIKELNKRLQRKGFSKSKVQENLQAEIFDICLNEAKEQKHKIIVVDTTKGFNIGVLAKKLGG